MYIAVYRGQSILVLPCSHCTLAVWTHSSWQCSRVVALGHGRLCSNLSNSGCLTAVILLAPSALLYLLCSSAFPSPASEVLYRWEAVDLQAHEDRNLARKLTPAEKKEKKLKKLVGEANEGDAPQVALYKVMDLSNRQHQFKVRVNAQVKPTSHPSYVSCSGVGTLASRALALLVTIQQES